MSAGRPRACRGRAWWRALLAAACLACAAAVPATASVLRFDPARDMDADVAAATRALLDEAEAKLPPAMQSLAPVTVRWSDRLPPDVAGRATRGTLLLKEAMRTALDAAPGDASGQEVRERLLATVIHELGHFHDRRAGLSRDPRLLDLAGWQERARKPGREGDNPFSDRSPDRYELASPAEFVAVNLEHFLLDPEYACRRPALYRYFAAHFEWEPGSPGCTPGIPYLDAAADEGDPALALLDAARVYEVHYLLAEGNHELMSRWGHSMLRLVVCAPGREPGPECRLDLSHHLVLSFRAFVDDVQLSSWAGLTGGYPSRLFVLPLEQVVEEYTAVQLRGLRSIPLDLHPAEIAMLLERTGRLHWSYDGRYRFIGNNCAVETFKLLHDGVPRLAGERLAAITPTGLLSKLERRGVADAAVLEDRDEALRLGYRFDSLEARFQQMLDVARAEFSKPPVRGPGAAATGERQAFAVATPAEWFELEPAARRAWMDHATPRAGAALLLLEHAARRRQLAASRDWLKRRYLEGGAVEPTVLESLAATLEGLLEGSGLATRPALLLAGEPGYGLPQEAERRVATERAAAHRQRLDALATELEAQVVPLLDPALAAGLAAIDDNIAALGARLREQQRAEGALVLP